jgi:hypothetical protein
MENIWITLIQSLCTLLGVYLTTRHSSKKAVKALESKVDRLVANDEDQYLSILRLTIVEENLPISERIIAGDKYLKKGGNGDTKKYYQKMLAEHTK